jgi:hypothetical protein
MLLSCSQNKDVKSMNEADKCKFAMEYNIRFHGSISDYESLSLIYFDNSDEYGFLKWAKIMADKYDYTQAYFDVFWSIYNKDYNQYDTTYNLDYLKKEEREMALKYLNIASNKGHKQAMYIIKTYILNNKYISAPS